MFLIASLIRCVYILRPSLFSVCEVNCAPVTWGILSILVPLSGNEVLDVEGVFSCQRQRLMQPEQMSLEVKLLNLVHLRGRTWLWPWERTG